MLWIKNLERLLKKKGIFITTIPVEIGPSLLIREIIGNLTNFHRPKYSKKELLKSALFKKQGPRNLENPHKNLDWRIINK